MVLVFCLWWFVEVSFDAAGLSLMGVVAFVKVHRSELNCLFGRFLGFVGLLFCLVSVLDLGGVRYLVVCDFVLILCFWCRLMIFWVLV